MVIKGLAAGITHFVHRGGSSHRKTESSQATVIWNIKTLGFPLDGQSREFKFPFQYQSYRNVCLTHENPVNGSFHMFHFPILENGDVLRWAASSTGSPFLNYFPGVSCSLLLGSLGNLARVHERNFAWSIALDGLDHLRFSVPFSHSNSPGRRLHFGVLTWLL